MPAASAFLKLVDAIRSRLDLPAALFQVRRLEPDEVGDGDPERQLFRDQHLDRRIVEFERVLGGVDARSDA